jgi:hypothetical protein
LNDVTSASVGGALFELHCLVAYDAANEINQRAFIIVGRAHFLFAIAQLSGLPLCKYPSELDQQG